MGLIDSALSGISNMLSAPGSLLQAGASLIGGALRNQSQADQATGANQFSAQQFANRYQTTVKDMEAAGLNPMLAYQQGASGQPSGQQAVMQDIATPAVSAYQNSLQPDVQASQAGLNRSSAQLNDAQIKVANNTADKINQEISNLKTDQEKSQQVILNLMEERQNLMKYGWNLSTQGDVMRATIENLKAQLPGYVFESLISETNHRIALLDEKLKSGDVGAMEQMGNFGRNYKELAPAIEIIKDILGIYSTRRSESTSTVRRVR